MFFLTPRTSDPLKADGDLEYPLTKLLVFTEHKDTIRRGGVASTLKSVRMLRMCNSLFIAFIVIETVHFMFNHIVHSCYRNPSVSRSRLR